jgi:hypothetical protein
MKIVFDMDNTLADEQGATLRPGIKELLSDPQKRKHSLVLWILFLKIKLVLICTCLGRQDFFLLKDRDLQGKYPNRQISPDTKLSK